MDLECFDQVCICHKCKACDIVVIANHQVTVFFTKGFACYAKHAI